jgi:arsenical pump membrane protein
MGSIGPLQAASVAMVMAVAINNLPAAALLAGTPIHHPIALLIGLNLGPNLAVSGSLSSVLWFQAAKSVSAQPSIRTYSWIGLFVVPTSVIVALVVSALAGRHL